MADLVNHRDHAPSALTQGGHGRGVGVEDVAHLRGRIVIGAAEARQVIRPRTVGSPAWACVPHQNFTSALAAPGTRQKSMWTRSPRETSLAQPGKRERRPSYRNSGRLSCTWKAVHWSNWTAVTVLPGTAADQAVDPRIRAVGRRAVDQDGRGCAGHGYVDEAKRGGRGREPGWWRGGDQRDRRAADRPVAACRRKSPARCTPETPHCLQDRTGSYPACTSGVASAANCSPAEPTFDTYRAVDCHATICECIDARVSHIAKVES